ncbi:MAG: GntR family transcriptional regulator [Armatimonadota bacterium]|nr:GntR family transcriptional regulator [Armatimonadota bacterium]MDR7535056.1 GntR family transcriptional regulator [Armatimonadota bacterium]
MPLYYQVESWLRQQVAGGRLQGACLPTEAALVRQLGVSRITIRRAMERLVQEGLIYRVPGRGTFANPRRAREFRIERNPVDLLGFEDDIRRAGLAAETVVLRRDWVDAPADVAAALGLASGEEVLWLYRRGTAGGRPLWVEDRYLVRRLGARLRPREAATPSLLATLARERGLTVNRAQVRISACEARREEARHLGLRRGAPVLAAEFVVHADGSPVQLVRARFRPDRYAFAFTIAPEATGEPDGLLRPVARAADVAPPAPTMTPRGDA